MLIHGIFQGNFCDGSEHLMEKFNLHNRYKTQFSPSDATQDIFFI
jgi:hypothetical protein